MSNASFSGLVGVARRDITPPVGIYARNWGAAAHDTAEGIHRPLTLTALSIQTRRDDPPLVLVDVDLGWWRSVDTERAFRRRILTALELDESCFIFALSHTHAAPPLAEPDPQWPGGDLLSEYLKNLERTTIATVKQAQANATAATLQWHRGRCALAANRDLLDPDKPRIVCGYNPAAEADDTLLVGRATDSSGKIIATLVNYACHPTTLAFDNKLLSPDFVGAMRETIEANTGGAPALFLQGASGELSPRHQYVADTNIADAHGRQLGFAALATLADMNPPATQLVFDRVVESGAPLAVWKLATLPATSILRAACVTIELPLKDLPGADELERRRAACTDRAMAERLRRQRDNRRSLGEGKTFALPFWVWRIGDAFVTGCMMESYSWMQRHLRRQMPGRAIIYMNLINGSIGYLPPAEMYAADAYQVWQTPFARGSLETLAAAMERSIDSLL